MPINNNNVGCNVGCNGFFFHILPLKLKYEKYAKYKFFIF